MVQGIEEEQGFASGYLRHECFGVEVLLVCGIAGYCLIVPASQCDKPGNISRAPFEQLGQ